MAQYFFDSQVRRYLLQFTRMFSNYYVEFTRDTEGTRDLYRVPIRYGDASRQAQTIMQENSASVMPSTPLMTFYIAGLDYDRPRIQNPTYVQRTDVRQRFYDENTGEWNTQQGNAFTLERLMPVPYRLSINLDIWTSNTNQKMQILEQIMVLFNPSLEIQASSNYLDWTTLSIVELVKTTWSSKTIPVGTEDPIDIATMEFYIPIWISSPMKVKKLGVVERIIASIYDSHGDMYNAIGNEDLLMGTRQCFTPFDYKVVLIGNKLQALRQPQVVQPPATELGPPETQDSDVFWPAIVNMYGVLRPGISLIALEQPDGSEIYGTVTFDPFDERFILYDIDAATLPSNTLPPVDRVVNPLVSGPGAGLSSPVIGQRYLFTEATGSDDGYAFAWAGSDNTPLIAYANDIVEYNGNHWFVSFDSKTHTDIEFVTNITTEIQYRWNGEFWERSYQNEYFGGQWRLIL